MAQYMTATADHFLPTSLRAVIIASALWVLSLSLPGYDFRDRPSDIT